MKLVVLGATGGTGRLVVEQALAAGHTVTALVRSPEGLTLRDPNLHVLAGRATDPSAVVRALDGADALISTLGGTGSVISDRLGPSSMRRPRPESAGSSFSRPFWSSVSASIQSRAFSPASPWDR